MAKTKLAKCNPPEPEKKQGVMKLCFNDHFPISKTSKFKKVTAAIRRKLMGKQLSLFKKLSLFKSDIFGHFPGLGYWQLPRMNLMLIMTLAHCLCRPSAVGGLVTRNLSALFKRLAENLRGKLITKAWIFRNTGKTHQLVAVAAISVRIADQADWLGS
ncbi:hypothetical protein WN944_009600 [Citrus x changshan-huyou]|uniref:Uncharacterized protein n=1 Tax=Citrus x changshan-huyou TaxID=2935761 RepID=A0AAP0QZX8_9ROSI